MRSLYGFEVKSDLPLLHRQGLDSSTTGIYFWRRDERDPSRAV